MVIFLLGKSQVGKDTICEYLKKYNFKRIAFADELKKNYALINNIDEKILHIQGPEKEFHRGPLIEYAENEKAKNENVWLEKAFEKYFNKETGLFDTKENLVISDCRRINEINWLEKFKDKNNIKLWYITRKTAPFDPDILTDIAIDKAFELTKNKSFIDLIIENDELNDTYLKIDTFLEKNLYLQ